MTPQIISKLFILLALVSGAQAFGLADSHFDFRHVSGETPMTASDEAYLTLMAELVGGTVGAKLSVKSTAGSDPALHELKMIHQGVMHPSRGNAVKCGIPCTGERRGQ